MSAAAFDPVAFVADMRAVGAVLTPFISDGQRLFSISGAPGRSVPAEALKVGTKWEDATLADPDWMGAVHDVLKAGERS